MVVMVKRLSFPFLFTTIRLFMLNRQRSLSLFCGKVSCDVMFIIYSFYSPKEYFY